MPRTPKVTTPGGGPESARQGTRHLGPQSQVAFLAALVFLLVGLALLAVLLSGLAAGVTGTGPLVLGGMALVVFGLSARLFMLTRKPAPAATSVAPPRLPAARAPRRPRPQPRPKGRPAQSHR